MTAKTSEEPSRETKIQAYAEALAYFIDEPKAVTDPTLGLFIDFFKARIAQEQERLAKGVGTQAQLAKT